MQEAAERAQERAKLELERAAVMIAEMTRTRESAARAAEGQGKAGLRARLGRRRIAGNRGAPGAPGAGGRRARRPPRGLALRANLAGT